MKARLLYPNRDFDWKAAYDVIDERQNARSGRPSRRTLAANPAAGLPWNYRALMADLAIDVLLSTMAGDDDCVHEVARRVILGAVTSDLDTIRYRQDVLSDSLRSPQVVRMLYAIATAAMDKRSDGVFGVLARYPDTVLRYAREQMAAFVEFLRDLRRVADRHAAQFTATGWVEFFAMLKRDLDDDYLACIERELEELRFSHGMLLSAELATADKGGKHLLHRTPAHRSHWLDWWHDLFSDSADTYHFELHPRDEAGMRALADIRNQGVGLAASALAQAADHVRDFFRMLRAELAFCVGCINLHERLSGKGEPTCFPAVAPIEARRLAFHGLYDVGLTLTLDRRVVGNDADADGKDLIVITGPNTGGKSTFMRAVGLAQLMMQSGMFVGADVFSGSLCDGLFTHYKREEDAGMESGKFDEELCRMSDIVDHIGPRSMILFNESFAATNEREGSEIGHEVIAALLESGVRAFCVTHMFELAHSFYVDGKRKTLFLRAGRDPGGDRTFRLSEGEPLATSFGEDLYDAIFSGTRTDTRPAAGSAIAGAVHEVR